MNTPSRLAWLLAAAALPLAAEEKPAAAGPAFEKLLEWNSFQIFGGKVALQEGGHFEVTFDGPGQVARGFEGKEILDAGHPSMKGGNRKFITKDKDQLYPGLACAGISQPSGDWTMWTSRFPVAGDARVTCGFRLPGLVTSQSGFRIRLNVDGKSHLETDFFHRIEKSKGGKGVSRRETPIKEYTAHPWKWFPRNQKDGVPVEVAVDGDRLKVSVDNKEIVSMDKVSDVSQGRVAIGYRKIVFTMQNLKISGTLDRAWCETEIEALRKAGKLLTRDPSEQPLPGQPPAGGSEKKKETEKEKDAEKDL